ncbi:hypothetical protein [Marinicella meishanensis]|uniref:hypothetical protein n=1 Tax=Marinicella meishanensis TaxID=2873263 RepID=UPI001CC06F83|nr:hypothetical protein [Marinicella sp. NBU2979]
MNDTLEKFLKSYAKTLILLAVVMFFLSGCGLTAKYKQYPDGVAETLAFEYIEGNQYELRQAVAFTRHGVEPAPEVMLEQAAHNAAYEVCGSFRAIKWIQFEYSVTPSVSKDSIYKHRELMQSKFACLHVDEAYEYGMRKTFIDNQTMEVIMMAYEVNFDEGFDIAKFLEDEFSFHAHAFCEIKGGIDNVDYDLNEGVLEYSAPQRFGLDVFSLEGSVSCGE